MGEDAGLRCLDTLASGSRSSDPTDRTNGRHERNLVCSLDVIEVVRSLFPFDPALDAMSGALEESGPSVATNALHLLALTAAYAALARLALRRFT